VLPYWVKITFGVVELTLLSAFLGLCGRNEEAASASHPATGHGPSSISRA